MFHGLAFGADATASSLAALLGAAEALSRFPAAAALPLQIVFAAFEGESYGRLGSRRFLAELGGANFSCQLNVSAAQSPTGRAFCAAPLRYDTTFELLAPSRVAFVVAADQLGLAGASFFAHPAATPGSAFVSEVLGALRAPTPSSSGTAAPWLPVADLGPATAPPGALPATPLLSFAEFAPRAAGAALAEYNTSLLSAAFQSRFDGAANVRASSVAAAATALARGLFALATNASSSAAAVAAVPGNLTANASFVAEFLACVVADAQCGLFARLLGVDAPTLAQFAPAGPLSLYTSVYQAPALQGDPADPAAQLALQLQPSLLEAVVRNALGAFAAPRPGGGGGGGTPPPCASAADCAGSAAGAGAECLLGQCLVAPAYYHPALSLALDDAAAGTGGAIVVRWPERASGAPGGDAVLTEPFWSVNVGVALLQRDAAWVDGALLAAGALATVAAAAGAVRFAAYMDEHFKVA